ncbi:MAG: diaminopimelate decarboxylase [Bacteroidales bacterium]|nr:diaminopimelate decarboxylase [Bacteroidales bacterium]
MLSVEKLSTKETPYYLYDAELLKRTVDEAARLSVLHGIEVHYAIKANNDARLLKTVAAAGMGADCVSGNEVLAAMEAGFPAEKVFYTGVGKTDREISSCLKLGIGCFNCESIEEIELIDQMAGEAGVRARLSVRINPDIDAHTHKYITTGLEENKFGISEWEFPRLVKAIKACANLDFIGLHFHIGSQITLVEEVFALECEKTSRIVDWFEAQGLQVNNIDLGGGLGIDYEDPDGHPVADFGTWMGTIAAKYPLKPHQKLHIEPGRAICGQMGSLISRVLFIKKGQKKQFMILDAGMNDLIRPALYQAYHKVENLSGAERGDADETFDVVGPVCESSDVWGTGRKLQGGRRGDIVALRSAGAYGQTMSSRYNMKEIAPAVWSDEL